MGFHKVLVLTVSLQIVLGSVFAVNDGDEINREKEKGFERDRKQVKTWDQRKYKYPFKPKATVCATCTPDCKNNGNCVPPGVCSCPRGFKGAQCETVDVCHTRHTGFEKVGNIDCKDFPEHGFTLCTMKCFENGKLKGPRESECYHKTGKFDPPIGTCTYPDDVNKDKEKLTTKEPKSSEPTIYKLSTNKNAKTRRSSVCNVWSGTNVKTFDGNMFKAPLSCSHTLILDKKKEEFGVVIRTCPFKSDENCPLSFQIHWKNIIFLLQQKNGGVHLSSTTNQDLTLSLNTNGLVFKPVGNDYHLVFRDHGITVIWDKHQYVEVRADRDIQKMRLGGICGTLDGNPTNDFIGVKGNDVETVKEFIDSWRVQEYDRSPQNQCVNENLCDVDYEFLSGCPGETKANDICKRILINNNMEECVKIFDIETLMNICVDEFCNCPNKADPQSCICKTMDMLVRHCKFYGLTIKRERDVCKVECDAPQIWSCGPKNEPTCGSTILPENEIECEEGCFCPDDTIRYKGNCIDVTKCPCNRGATEYPTGSSIPVLCNKCTCKAGFWDCTKKDCGKRTTGWGDPHYTTFDGRKYDFMGKGSFYILKMENFAVLGENSYCHSNIVSCTSSLTVIAKIFKTIQTIKLLKNKVVRLNDKPVVKFPKFVQHGQIIIKQEGEFVTVTTASGIRVLWNGVDKFHVDVPGMFYGNTSGLGGTMNDKTNDDFLTPEGDVETSVNAFGHKWKVKDTDGYLSDDPGLAEDAALDEEEQEHPCERNEGMIEFAQKLCDLLEGDIFLSCHDNVGPAEFRDNCMFDGCACGDNVTECFCPVFSAYADECSRQGTPIVWRDQIKECAIQCPVGQIYVECGDACIRTCDDLATANGICEWSCIAGCRCPEGQYFNDKNECVPSNKCQCSHEGIVFNSGYKEVRPNKDALELCTCEGGTWKCGPPGPEDQEKYPSFSSEAQKKCARKPFAEFSLCVPPEPITCSNMYNYIDNLEDCQHGCMCKEGYVYDNSAKLCVQPEDCSCHHSGKSFAKGDQINEDCNVCQCNSGKWKCTTNKCEATCSVWGDSHFTTFDNLDFDFQGECDYILSRGVADNGDAFSITIQNVLCGTMGVTCSKSLKIVLNGSITDTITLSKDTPFLEEEEDAESKLPFEKLLEQLGSKKSEFNVYKAGVFIVLDIVTLKIQVKWDEGTRIYVRLGSDWAGKVDGLCGNYNENSNDDMKTPARDLQMNPLHFGHAWKLQEFCAPPTLPIDSCKEHPERANWAKSKCNIIKSSLFKACHSVVPFEKYLKRCIFDTCACDEGGDCECLCTAIGAYAHSCSMKGIHIRWRTQHLCPMQCGRQWSEYEACTPACGIETCDNFHDQANTERMCLKENCFEGCIVKPCDEGMIYLDDSLTKCVPKSKCKPYCMEKIGKVFYEGDLISSNDCQTCWCKENKEVCNEKSCVRQIETVVITHYEEWTSTEETETTSYAEPETTMETITEQYKPTKRPFIKAECPKGMKTTITGQLATRNMAEIYRFTKHRINEIPVSKNRVKDIHLPLPEVEDVHYDIQQYTEYLCMHDSNTTVSKCPQNYDYTRTPKMKPDEFACILHPHRDNICELSGTSFTTFDGTVFKYDACSHILARSLGKSAWHISVQLKCTNDDETCHKELIIKDVNSKSILTIRPNLEVQINEVIITSESLKNEPLTTKSGYILSHPGSNVLVVRPLYGFWVLYDKMGRIKIGVSEKFIKTVDGLCGYFNDKKADDMRLPDGKTVSSMKEFGDSWYDNEIPKDKCQPQVYSKSIQKMALDVCNTIEHPSFVECHKTNDYKRFVEKCIEIASQCLDSNDGDTKFCKCSILQEFVAQCLVMNPKIQLDTWRAVHKCEVSCPAPMVYSDCNKRRCQPICDKLYGNDCTMLADACFSGCFCPEGTLRKGDSCIPINECKDCLCDLSKHLQYDQKNFTSNSKCTYLLSRDIVLPDVHTFKVFVTTDYCKVLGLPPMGNKPTCVKSSRILYGNHMIHIQRARPDEPLQMLIDGIELNQIPFKDTWLDITKTNGNELKFILPESRVELTSSFDDMTFSIHASIGIQQMSRNKEYNCDECNDPQMHQAECLKEDVLVHAENCIIIPPDKDLCLKILDENIFGKCHRLIDPTLYISKCQQSMCKATQKGICKSLASYAKECTRKGICVDWRSPELCPLKCPLPLKYEPCGCPKTCATIKANKVFGIATDNQDCGAAKSEGCYCPNNKILDNEKCVVEEQCIKCFDGVHSIGETWQRDKCTECNCNKDGKTECVEKQCPVLESICSEGFIPSRVNSPEDCCTKYICVQEPKTPIPDKCPNALLPQCGPDQTKKQKTGADGCPQFICECNPESKCEPLPESVPLKPGEKLVHDKSGCCPVQKIFCDKNTCPDVVAECQNKFYEFKVATRPGDCCPTIVCTPPKFACIAEINSIKTLKDLGATWVDPAKPCIYKVCAYGPNSTPEIHEITEKCNEICPKGFKYQRLDTSQCCGVCIQTSCVFKDRLYANGEEWLSPDKCTTYSCININGQFLISSTKDVCPDVSNCPEEQIENRGCCKICKPVAENLQGDCLPVSLSDDETKKLFRVSIPQHGICGNAVPIRGFTICKGYCQSGSKYNAQSFGQEHVCVFCSIAHTKVMTIPFKCEDGYNFVKDIPVPRSCGCDKCPLNGLDILTGPGS